MTLHKTLIAVVLLLSILAAFIGTPQRSDLNIDEIAALVEREQDHITPLELAEQLYAGKKIRLIDLRDSSLHALNTIAHAENMTLREVLNGEIKRNEVVVLYSEGGVHASQAWILLKTQRFDSIFTLLGGFTGWKNEILYPVILEGSTNEERLAAEQRKKLSRYFGGEPTIVAKKTPSTKKQPTRRKADPPSPPVKFQKEEEKFRDQC